MSRGGTHAPTRRTAALYDSLENTALKHHTSALQSECLNYLEHLINLQVCWEMFDQEEKSDHNSIFNLSELLRSEHVRTRFCDLNTHTHTCECTLTLHTVAVSTHLHSQGDPWGRRRS